MDEVERGKNRTQSSLRARVEHPFRVIKRVWVCRSPQAGGL